MLTRLIRYTSRLSSQSGVLHASFLRVAEELCALEANPLDILDEKLIHEAAASLASLPIDVLINNAGAFESCSLFMTSKKDLMRQFEVNTVGPFLMTRAFQPNLKQAAKQYGSSFVFHLSSQLGSISDNTFSYYYGYRASKSALNMINKSLAIDLKADNIGCVLLSPGYVSTDMTSYNGTMTASESVTQMTKVMGTTTLADSGKWFKYNGNVLSW